MRAPCGRRSGGARRPRAAARALRSPEQRASHHNSTLYLYRRQSTPHPRRVPATHAYCATVNAESENCTSWFHRWHLALRGISRNQNTAASQRRQRARGGREDGRCPLGDDPHRHCDGSAPQSHISCAAGERRALVTSLAARVPPAGDAMASTMQLEFTQAMTDFKTMFPDMDDDVIEAVLRANQGAVDATIDQLLAMSTDNQNERLRLEMERVEGGSPRRTQRRGRSSALDSDDTAALVDVDDVSLPLAVRRKWIPRMLGPLPPMFLRIPPGTDARIDLSLEMDDDRIATFLQNEEFMAELRWNQEFMAALDSEQGQKSKGHDDEAVFKERLKNMGKLSRKKFAQLSRMFSRGGSRRAGGARAPPRGPPDSLLLQEEHSDDDDRPQKHNKI